MTTRLPCLQCSALILPDTALKNNGLCLPCKGGYREKIEQGKRQKEIDRAYDQSPERKYWFDLVKRVYESPDGFLKLNSVERTYYAVSCLIGEVYNGGFDQFFSNSSGEVYAFALDGLRLLGANESAALLLRAKEILFGVNDVPSDSTKRNKLMPTAANDDAPEWQQLDELDKAFYTDQDKLPDRCRAFAIENCLYIEG